MITAYDGPGALGMLEKFPNVDAVIIHSGLGESAYKKLLQAAQSGKKRLIFLISPNATARDERADFHLSSHDPKELLDIVVDRFQLPEDA
ncbi:hypothetical protein [Candidatus Korobacter versatilis]|uniref:hypothetical protein n=1 Tax=Candidatus Korobacter versatilis TaxID=658062 RepID=UPI0011D136E3|nr:hypothetical protein [Candidatus Koribacter versatilis]